MPPPSVTPSITRTSSVFPSSQMTGVGAGSRTITVSTGGLGGASSNWQDQIPEGYEVVSKTGNRVLIRPVPGTDLARRAQTAAQQAAGAGVMQGPFVGNTQEVYQQRQAATERMNQQQATAERQERARGSQANYRAQVQASQEYNRQVFDGYRDGPRDKADGPSPADFIADAATGTVTRADGTPVSAASYDARTALQTARASATFSSLNAGDAITASSRFVLSYGERLDSATGNERTSSNQDLRVGGRNASQTTLTERGGPVQNTVTIQTGLRWFQQLATRDRAAYNAMVVQLRNAGYMGATNDAQLPLNGYTREAGAAFATAAQDLADNFQVGETEALLPWLTRRGQGYADYLSQQESDAAAQAAYKPVDRSYTDPEAVKQAAKEAAIAALGRKLTDEEEARFEAQFKGKESGYYDAIDAAGRAKTAASVADPNLGAQAEAFVDGDQYDTERATQQVGQYAQVFQKMMGV